MATKSIKINEDIEDLSWSDIERIIGAIKEAAEKSEALADESKDEKDYANALSVAKIAKIHYKAFLEAGFNEEQAFEFAKILFKEATMRA